MFVFAISVFFFYYYYAKVYKTLTLVGCERWWTWMNIFWCTCPFGSSCICQKMIKKTSTHIGCGICFNGPPFLSPKKPKTQLLHLLHFGPILHMTQHTDMHGVYFSSPLPLFSHSLSQVNLWEIYFINKFGNLVYLFHVWQLHISPEATKTAKKWSRRKSHLSIFHGVMLLVKFRKHHEHIL
jgi:hypothetical protein